MKKIFLALGIAFALLIVPQCSEASHQYIGTIGNNTCYVDTDTIRHFDAWMVFATVISVSQGGYKNYLEYKITVNTDYETRIERWVYSTKGDSTEYHISYNNPSGYLRDWLVNVYGWWPKYRDGTPMHPIE